MSKPFDKILIANRGEIACRVIRTAKRLGIATVAVYSEADRRALHVEQADEAVCIGEAEPARSYLKVDAILDACRATGAQAVHPGYGFLSENRVFCETLTSAGIAFIGPPPKAIEAMGDKITSKRIAAKAGVRTIPGHDDVVQDAEDAVRIARDIAYPVMLKASAGGGGKGMRIAGDDDECRDGFARAASEARTSFGDERIFIEKFIEEPRHIEIQLLADRHGACVYLGERECSIQRRHQKIIEEAPSPFLDSALRRKMGEQAVALAKATGYESAGTVEFVVDDKRNFYFLEMNTRLQVEHPITEMVTGIDLVESMIRIAAGEPLGFAQEDIEIRGWAMESRVCAENPRRAFVPSIGRLVRYSPPQSDDFVRVDAGVKEGGEISMYYDSLIAKLITGGKTRDEAIARMRIALDEYRIRGLDTNLPFLASVFAHPRFASGEITTHFIDQEYPQGFVGGEPDDPTVLVAAAAIMQRRYRRQALRLSGQMPGFVAPDEGEWIVRLGQDEYACRVRLGEDGEEIVEFEGKTLSIRSDWRYGQALFRAAIDGEPTTVQVERQGIGFRLSHGGAQADVEVLNPRQARLRALMIEASTVDSSRFLLSPMPGLLIGLAVKEGDEVKQGQELAVVEAMKMENVLRAEGEGRVKALCAKVGDSLAADQPIIEFEA
ncbi:MAG: acetyl/propionyl/methylcrotonyl-CoA carboxylase subunit alpha [Ectothiorhodospiraceae bacterium AqS1]|nr:acetyl/propionyl/methylcrotonyl-CoA carboxylase subunit alpha [Ectothiorhodospiraceae bacterium AqS1]MBF2759653.1 acetyl/propionyl/methylcrotonyl-CoA carboxylase subunit alpha [Ectothiorhodospiraceae bacterium AqS1]